jgi:hypothetical protein
LQHEPAADEFILSLVEQLCPVLERTFELMGCDQSELPEGARNTAPKVRARACACCARWLCARACARSLSASAHVLRWPLAPEPLAHACSPSHLKPALAGPVPVQCHHRFSANASSIPLSSLSPAHRLPRPQMNTLVHFIDKIDRAVRRKLLRARQILKLQKTRAREHAKLEGSSPRSTVAAEDRAGFRLELRPVLEPFEQRYDVANIPYDMADEFTALAIEASRRELQSELDRRAKGAEED